MCMQVPGAWFDALGKKTQTGMFDFDWNLIQFNQKKINSFNGMRISSLKLHVIQMDFCFTENISWDFVPSGCFLHWLDKNMF